MSKAIFFRLLDVPPEEKGEALALLHDNHSLTDTFLRSVSSFLKIPGAPFAYWGSERLIAIFECHQALGSIAAVKQGLATADDFRFVRTWWEVPASTIGYSRPETRHGATWIHLAKGGAYSKYYSDIHLVVDWENDGQRIRSFYKPNGRLASRPQNIQHYARPGLTWPLRTQKGLNFRAIPRGCAFGHKGPTVMMPEDQAQGLYELLGIVNSSSTAALVELQMAFGSYEVGVIQRTPIPEDLSGVDTSLVLEAHDLTRRTDETDETTHAFGLPGLAADKGGSLLEAGLQLETATQARATRLADIQAELDEVVFDLYGLGASDRVHIRREMNSTAVKADDADSGDDDEPAAPKDLPQRVQNLLMWCVGVAFGRWDVRFAVDPTLLPTLQGPFDPLPRVAPGGLVGTDGLPASEDNIAAEAWLRARQNVLDIPNLDARCTPENLPLPIAWNGILVDDPTHPDDLVNRVATVIHLLWQERADAIIREACAILGFNSLRDYFRHPSKGFFSFHIKRYSKSRRKAPIYWLLQSEKRNYAIWLYCHRLHPDAYYAAARNPYADTKVSLETQKLADLQQGLTALDGATLKRRQRQIETQRKLVDEVTAFRKQLDTVAKLDLPPDLNDGILISMAPLHSLIPWKEVGKMWDKLVAGDHTWSTMAQQMKQKGLVAGK